MLWKKSCSSISVFMAYTKNKSKPFLRKKWIKSDFHVCLVIKYDETKFSCGNSIWIIKQIQIPTIYHVIRENHNGLNWFLKQHSYSFILRHICLHVIDDSTKIHYWKKILENKISNFSCMFLNLNIFFQFEF